jgi:hypothetical protein
VAGVAAAAAMAAVVAVAAAEPAALEAAASEAAAGAAEAAAAPAVCHGEVAARARLAHARNFEPPTPSCGPEHLNKHLNGRVSTECSFMLRTGRAPVPAPRPIGRLGPPVEGRIMRRPFSNSRYTLARWMMSLGDSGRAKASLFHFLHPWGGYRRCRKGGFGKRPLANPCKSANPLVY